MSRASPAFINFNAGELSPLLEGRQDLDFYTSGCSVLENFIPTVQGPARYRPGTVYVDRAAREHKSWLARFEFNYEQAYLLEFNDAHVGFFSNRGRVTVSRTITDIVNNNNGTGGCRVTAAGHGFQTGHEVTISGVVGAFGQSAANMTHIVTRIDADTFDTPTGFAGGYASGGVAVGPYTVATPYTAASLENDDGSCALSSVQVGDVVYLAGGDAPPQTLSRTGAANWILAEFDPDDGPYMDLNDNESLTVYASAATGNVALHASAALFTQLHVGALIRLEPIDITVEQWEPTKAVSTNDIRRYGQNVYRCTDSGGTNSGTVPPTHVRGAQKDGSANAWKEWTYLHSGYGVARITSVTSGTQAAATVLSRIPADAVGSGNPTWRWRFGAWGGHNEYPTKVGLWRDRLVFAGIRHEWMSQAGDYDSFAPDEYGVQTPASAITIRPASPDNNAIRWMHPADALLIGTASTEFAAKEITSADPVGPGNIKANPQTADGGRAVSPVRIGDAVFFVQRAGRELRQISYDIQRDSMVSADMTRRAEHITKSGLIDMAYQHTPDSILWCVRADGVLLGLTYEQDQDVIGWHRHIIGTVESVQCIPSPDGLKDDVWLCVRRRINGQDVRYIERLSEGIDTDEQNAVYLDSSIAYDGIVNATLMPGSGATVAGTVGVGFAATAAVFAPTDVGKEIHYRYEAGGEFRTAKAVITGYFVPGGVSADILSPWPSLDHIPANGWRLTATMLSGLAHLEGETVSVVADGAEHPDATVQNGQIVLSYGVGIARVGLKYIGRLRTMRIEAGSREGSSQGKIKRISKVVVRVKDARGLTAGPDFQRQDELLWRSDGDEMNEVIPLFSGDKLIEWDGGYETDGCLCIQQSKPFPATVVALYPQVNTSDR